MRHVDGRLSDRASATWPGALVVRYNAGAAPKSALAVDLLSANRTPRRVASEQWVLERPGADPVDLGGYYMAAVRALGALIRAEKAKRATS